MYSNARMGEKGEIDLVGHCSLSAMSVNTAMRYAKIILKSVFLILQFFAHIIQAL